MKLAHLRPKFGGPRRRFSLLSTAAMLAVALVVLGLVLMWLETSFIYFPMRFPQGDWNVTSSHRPGDPRIEDIYLTTSDAVRIHGWYAAPDSVPVGAVPSRQPQGLVILLLHGNAGNVTHRYDWLHELVNLGAQVLAIDYRGFGRSQGKPSEAGLYRDAQAAWDYLVGPRHIDPRHIVILGESLGGAPAIELAARVAPGGLIVQSSFTCLPDVARHHMPWVPRFLIRTQMDSADRISQVTCPKLFIHSRDDEIIPYELGRRLYEAAPQPREFLELRGAGHNDTCFVPGYYDRLRLFLDQVAANANGTSSAPVASSTAAGR